MYKPSTSTAGSPPSVSGPEDKSQGPLDQSLQSAAAWYTRSASIEGSTPSVSVSEDKSQDSLDQDLQSAAAWYKPSTFMADSLASLSLSDAKSYTYYQPVEEDNDPVPEIPTPRSRKPAPRSRTMNYDALDNEDLSKYVVEHSRKFVFGTVFKVVWSEPVLRSRLPELDQESVQTDPSAFNVPSTPASSSPKASPSSESGLARSLDGAMSREEIRHFIVIDGTENGARNGNSICIPISTYKRQACTKAGVKPGHHGIIHTQDRIPMMLNGEPDLGFDPIRLVVKSTLQAFERLSAESRVNYSKFVTIEHNSPVYIIGLIHPDDLEILESAVDNCWERRILDSKKQKKDRRH